jgi:hypothetical protein
LQVLEFESKLDWAKWEEKQGKFESFFGPGEQAGGGAGAGRE